jgi:hypothetical protein
MTPRFNDSHEATTACTVAGCVEGMSNRMHLVFGIMLEKNLCLDGQW